MTIIKWILGLAVLYGLFLGGFYVAQQDEVVSSPEVKKTVSTVSSIVNGSQHWVGSRVASFQKKRQGLADLTVPKQNGQLPTGETIPNQWQHNLERFVFVAQHDAKIYAQPRIDSLEKKVLLAGDRVRVAFVDPVSVTVDNVKTQWVFVSSTTGETPLGWMLNHNLAYRSSFAGVSNWQWDTFEFCKGQYCASYSVTEDGSFENHWSAQGGELFLEGRERGKLLRYKDVVWAKKQSYEDVIDVFVVNQEGGLSQEARYKESPVRIITL